MRISSVRLGHANNSSSTHSILLNCPTSERDDDNGPFQFGWGWFHLKTRERKAEYLAALIYSTLSREMADEHAAVVAASLTGLNPLKDRDDGDEYLSVYVDHQSMNAFPLEFGGEHYDPAFMREFVEYVRDNPAVSIRGGNDNEDDPGDIGGQRSPINQLERDCGKIPLFCRKDRDWWILYNRQTGAKVRLSFTNVPTEYFKAAKPELVDVKVTDFCPHGCEFCYQSSTVEGKHGLTENIEAVAYACRQAKVFEVALGGGEPTKHPEFAKILEKFSLNGVTPNFTTFNMAWIWNKEIVAAIRRFCGSFAVSSPNAVGALADWNKNREGNGGVRGTLQMPLGCYPDDKTRHALKAARKLGVPVTLLGYKHHGRGEMFRKGDYSWILDFLAEEKFFSFGADTVFVEQFGDELKRRGVSPTLMASPEGAFSCYIDAVNMTMGRSSYTKDLHPVDKRDIFQMFPYAA